MAVHTQYLAVTASAVFQLRSGQHAGQYVARRGAKIIVIAVTTENVTQATMLTGPPDDELHELFSTLADQLSIAHGTVEIVREMVAPWVVIENANDLVTVQTCQNDELYIFRFTVALSLAGKWPSTFTTMTANSISAELAAQTPEYLLLNWKHLQKHVKDFLFKLFEHRTSVELTILSDSLLSIPVASGSTSPNVFLDHINMRRRMASILLLYQRSEDTASPILNFIHQAIRQLDALGSATTSLMLLHLQDLERAQNVAWRALEAENDARARRADRSDRMREHRITRFVAAFVLPTVWSGLLGANIIPEKIGEQPIATWWSVSGACVIAAVLAFVGWKFTPTLTKDEDAAKDA